MTIYIDVPDMNDSKSRITLSGKEFMIRFTYSSVHDHWYFSLYSAEDELLLGMIKILPLFPLTEYYTDVRLPDGTQTWPALGEMRSRMARQILRTYQTVIWRDGAHEKLETSLPAGGGNCWTVWF